MKKYLMAVLFADKTRWQHFWVGIQTAVTFTILCTLGAMSAAEFKDEKYGGKWDWGDWVCGMIGGAIGQSVQIAVAVLLWHWMR